MTAELVRPASEVRIGGPIFFEPGARGGGHEEHFPSTKKEAREGGA